MKVENFFHNQTYRPFYVHSFTLINFPFIKQICMFIKKINIFIKKNQDSRHGQFIYIIRWKWIFIYPYRILYLCSTHPIQTKSELPLSTSKEGRVPWLNQQLHFKSSGYRGDEFGNGTLRLCRRLALLYD